MSKKYLNATSPRPINRKTQNTETPKDFFTICTRIFDFQYDLAADKDNFKCTNYLTEKDNSLIVPWKDLNSSYQNVYFWLNPPYSDITPWVKKCSEYSLERGNVCVLLPASVDSNWYKNYVEPFATMRWLNPRLKFVGHTTSYPKPLMLAIYDLEYSGPNGFSCQWRWDKEEFYVPTNR